MITAAYSGEEDTEGVRVDGYAYRNRNNHVEKEVDHRVAQAIESVLIRIYNTAGRWWDTPLNPSTWDVEVSGFL